ncbi:hypothetical protein BJ875DRAFT_501529 [Amylocarpus encephaloides]|uniref:Uncharacterized protein n=1 Tax=Amylocarpus encephaloides TaxID=45428 RepID=A0A9P8C9Y0_9HELO|nr:hypothetical protein BJ875DRAFT_501529 [Amylocarpus encephaloides]
MNYGHEKYLDILQGQKATITKALERLERRTAEVLYKKEQWFNWRHWKATEQRMNVHQAKENKKRQDSFLEKIYRERTAKQEEDSEMDCDPIEDILEDTRGDFIKETMPTPVPVEVATPASTENRIQAKKGKKKKNKSPSAHADTASERTPDKSLIESKEEMAQRLEHGMDYNHDEIVGVMAGTYENPVIETKTAYSIEEFLADNEVTPAALRDPCFELESPGLQEIRDACVDLFRKEDEEEEEDSPMTGTDNEEVKEERDFRPRKRPGDLPDEWKLKRDKIRIAKEVRERDESNFPPLDAHFGQVGSTAIDFGDWDRKLVKYRDPIERRKGNKIRVSLCGRTIWNYPSNKTMTRAGWMQFCIIAKDRRVEDAVELCRHWDEFFELNILACWNYFPGANWVHWIGGRPKQQLLQMASLSRCSLTVTSLMSRSQGFITYYESNSPDAEQITVHHQSGRHGPQRRSHAMFEARNIIALRCRTGLNMYRNESEFLKTLCRPTESHRVRNIRLEDGRMKSIWDEMSHEKTRFFYGEITKDDRQRIRDEYLGLGTEAPMPINNLFPRFALYRDTDAAEDKILFPEENMDPLDIGKPTEPIRSWEAEGFSLNRFVKGMDLVDSDIDSEGGEIVSDDGDEEWDDEESEEDEDDDMFDLEAGDDGPLKPGESKNMDLMLKLLQQPEDTRDRGDYNRINDEFMRFMDKEKFNTDLEPHAQNRYSEMLAMAKASRKYAHKYLMGFDTPTTFLRLTIMVDMTVPQEDSKDAHKAVAKVAPFFDKGFLDHELGAKFKNSLLFKLEDRARALPCFRTQVSNKMRPAAFWKPYDEACKAMKHKNDLEALPLEYESTTRPIIAHLYKSGILRTRSHQYFAGKAFSTAEPSRPGIQDFFIDYRVQIPTIKMPPTMVDTYTVTPFKTTAQKYAAKHPNARFSILRLWSSAYFYPLMIGPKTHDATAFRDTIRRNFIWMFIPKDMPCSEWSIHFRLVRGLNLNKRDKYLVMAENKEELCKLTSMVVYAVERRPWRHEIDLWKSFLDVDSGFVQRLDDA